MWTYATADALTDVDGSGYFNAAAAKLQVGDWVFVSSSSTYGIHIVTGNTRDLAASPPVEGVVDVTNALAAGAIDSD
jgi:predicted Mrr-cat superfamily restriction endonuclease